MQAKKSARPERGRGALAADQVRWWAIVDSAPSDRRRRSSMASGKTRPPCGGGCTVFRAGSGKRCAGSCRSDARKVDRNQPALFVAARIAATAKVSLAARMAVTSSCRRRIFSAASAPPASVVAVGGVAFARTATVIPHLRAIDDDDVARCGRTRTSRAGRSCDGQAKRVHGLRRARIGSRSPRFNTCGRSYWRRRGRRVRPDLLAESAVLGEAEHHPAGGASARDT